jgi:hypothetical protein
MSSSTPLTAEAGHRADVSARSIGWRAPLFWFMLVFTLVLAVTLYILDAPLRTDAAPRGIISYEFAWTVTDAQNILDSWQGQPMLYAAFQLGLDYLYMPSYALTIALGCAWAAGVLGRKRPWPYVLGLGLAAWQAPAALLDATENFALVKMVLNGVAAAPWPTVAAICASIKFALIIVGLAFSLAGALAWGIHRVKYSAGVPQTG